MVVAAAPFDQVPDAQCAVSACAERQLAAGVDAETCDLLPVASHDLQHHLTYRLVLAVSIEGKAATTSGL